jgi:hypothetical protein
MAEKKDEDTPAGDARDGFAERRREERFSVPDVYSRYITLKVKVGEEFVPAVLGNFSRHGILFESPAPFEQGARTQCIIAVSLLLSREISIGINVRYCYSHEKGHIIGAYIEDISDEVWFDVFVGVHDFIVVRQGAVY